MSRKNLTPELLPPKVPAYIVTFSDMVTLLLTFFVMLQTLARDQDAELFKMGRDSFIKSIRYIGLGVLFGKQNTPPFGNVKTRHYISDTEETDNRRTIDANREKMRRILAQMARFATVMPSDLVADKTRFWVTTIRFASGGAELDDAGRKYLTEFYGGLREAGGIEKVKLYVLGLAPDESTPARQWQLSARRAQVVADFLTEALRSNLRRPVYSWGGGPGGDWVGADSPISEKSHILIAVLSADE